MAKSKKRQLRYVHWRDDEAADRAKRLRGFHVDHRAPRAGPDYKALREAPPDAVVIDLSRLPSHGRELAIMVRRWKATRHLPIVFVEGAKEKVDAIRELLPDATYCTWDDALASIHGAIDNAPAQPVVPAEAGYAPRPLPQKLGIKANTTLALIDGPDDFAAKTLGALPDGVALRHDARARTDMTLWFVTQAAQLRRRIGAMAKRAGDGRRLWIVWPKKTSGVRTDVVESLVRETGLSAGLVDHKICRVDDVWSALAFAVRST